MRGEEMGENKGGIEGKRRSDKRKGKGKRTEGKR